MSATNFPAFGGGSVIEQVGPDASCNPPTPAPVWNLAMAWIAAIPLLFLAMGARLIPDTQDVGLRVSQMEETGGSHRVPLALVILICSGLIFTQRSKVLSACWKFKLVLAVPILALFSTLWSDIPGHTLMSAAILFLFTCFAIYLGVTYSHNRILELITLTGVIGVVLSYLAVVAMPSVGGQADAWRGIFGNKQNTACVVTLFLITAIHWKPPTALYRLGRLLYVFLCCVLIVMSQSRTGWGLCLLGVGLSVALWLLQKMPAKQSLSIVLLAVPFALAIAYALYTASGDILHAVGKDPTLNERTVIWAAALNSIQLHPLLGYGYAAFWRGMAGPSLNMILASGWELWQSQDGYLDLWLQVGIGGVLLLALLILQAGINGLRVFRRRDDGRYVRWCIVVLICALVYDIGETSLFIQRFSWFLLLLACIGLQQIAQAVRENAAEHSYSPERERPSLWVRPDVGLPSDAT